MSQLTLVNDNNAHDLYLKSLYKVGGIAALIAGLLFRRNIAAEIGVLAGHPALDTVYQWFELLQQNRLLGLVYLNVFDIINYALLGLMFLALYPVLSKVNRGYALIASFFGILGTAIYFSSNTAFAMLSLSNQYASASTEAQKSLLLAAGQAMLSINRFSDALAYPGTGGYISLVFIALAGMISSVLIIQSKIFNRITGFIGILANTLDLIYCIVFALVPTLDHRILSICFIPAAGLFLMIWHIMVGWKLYQLGNLTENQQFQEKILKVEDV